MFMKTKELGWKEHHGIQYIDIDDSKGIIMADKETLTIWENFTEFYDRTNRPEIPKVEPEDSYEKAPDIF